FWPQTYADHPWRLVGALRVLSLWLYVLFVFHGLSSFIFLRSLVRQSPGTTPAAAASRSWLQNIQSGRCRPAFQPYRRVRCELLQALRRFHQLRAVHAAFAAFAIAVFRNFMAKRVRPQMSHLAQKRHRRLLVAVLQLPIRRAHAAKRLNLAPVANRRARTRLIANLTQRPFPAFQKAALADV